MATDYDVGDVARISTTTVFTDISGAAFDPDTVTFKWRRPGQTAAQAAAANQSKTYLTDSEVVKDGVGDYHIDLELDAPGTWRYRVEGATSGGDPVGADEGELRVKDSDF